MKRLARLVLVVLVATVAAGLPAGVSAGPLECPAGWCTSTTQCQQWYGGDSFCGKQPGRYCGLCT